MKTCIRCGTEKAKCEFHRDKQRIDGYYPKCKSCVSLYQKQHYVENRDEILKRMSLYVEKNRNVISERRKKEYLDNKEKICARVKRYQNANKKKLKQYRKDNSTRIRCTNKRHVTDMTDAYIAGLMGVKIDLLPGELIKLKREHLRLTRKLKEAF